VHAVSQVLPERGKEVSVLIDDKFYDATLMHNDWMFNAKHYDELGIKFMNDHWDWGNKITHWKEK
jgi:hypothetical protein